MKPGDNPYTSATGPNHGRFWFGSNLTQFLKAELSDFPGRRVAALRLFTVALAIALVSQTLHVPPLGAIALLVCLSYDAYANTGQSLLFGLRQLGYLMVTTLVSVFTLMFAGNDAWLLLSLSFIILALALFHARLIAWPTSVALWYSVAVLYSPSNPEAAIYNALWTVPLIGMLALGAWTVVHWAIKPQDPLKLLQASIAAQLAAVQQVFSGRLVDSGLPGHKPEALQYPAVGSFGKLLTLLENAELIHPAIQKRHETYRLLLLEIDGLRQLTDWLDAVLAAEYRTQPMSQEKLNVYLALQSACALLRRGVEESRDVSVPINRLLADEVLHSYAGQTHPSLLTALWRALQSVASLLHDLQQPIAPPPSTDTDQATEDADTYPAAYSLPACFSYGFWAAHADSLQYGVKFSLGAILCMLVVQGLDWPDINTAIPTCLVAAQTSLGADYRLSLLRLSGAALGGLCAYFYVLVLQAQFDTIVGFALATTPFWAIAAWITAGSERIAYLGRQLGFSFALFVLHDFGAATDLYLPRDRVIGILLGLVVMGVLDYALWPRRSIVLARQHSVSALRTLAKLTVRLPDKGHLLHYTLPLRLSAEKDMAAAHGLIAHAVLEPDARLAQKTHERAMLRAVIKEASYLSGLLLVRKRYRLLSGQRFSHFPEQLQQYSRVFDASLATALEQSAQVLAGEPVAGSTDVAEVADKQMQLQQSYIEHLGIGSLADDLAMEWELRFMLDRQIVELIRKIGQTARDAVASQVVVES